MDENEQRSYKLVKVPRPAWEMLGVLAGELKEDMGIKFTIPDAIGYAAKFTRDHRPRNTDASVE